MRKRLLWFLIIALLITPAAIGAQDVTPSVTVNDQYIYGNRATIAEVVSEGPGWLVIHADDNGAPGTVIGYGAVNEGVNTDVQVTFDAALATPTLHAMLHNDTGTVGEYEFGTVDQADTPVTVDGNVVMQPFTVAIINAADQLPTENTITLRSVTLPQDGFVVVHGGSAFEFGEVIGWVPVPAGTTRDLVIEINVADDAEYVWPMLHVDTGTVGEYEFGQVEGVDGPVMFGQTLATSPIYVAPQLIVSDQIIIPGDAMMSTMELRTVTADLVVSDGPGWVVIHVNDNGSPGAVAGFAHVEGGRTENVEVTLDQGVELTPILWPMLHNDTGTVGEYEFGTVDGADTPVRAGGNVVTFPINAAPSLTVAPVSVSDTSTITVPGALIDADGWLVIHANDNGSPGEVIGFAPIHAGVNVGVEVTVETTAVGDQVFPMLHYDTNTMGEYEFGVVEGADSPVTVNGEVVVEAMAIE